MGHLFQPSVLLVDLYELMMAQVYFRRQFRGIACFEVMIRSLPPNWGFFVFAGLPEVDAYLRHFHFGEDDLAYLKTTGIFYEDFLSFLQTMELTIELRVMPEGTVFFPLEPILEVKGSLIAAQLLESYLLNILGFSIIEASLAARIKIAAQGRPLVDFGLRRAQGPVAALRAARAAHIAGFAATSNVFAAKEFGFRPSGTMAHSFVQVHASQRDAFLSFVEMYGEASVLVIDTYNPWEGIRDAAWAARHTLDHRGLRIDGIRIDSGDFVGLSQYARNYFLNEGIGFMKIYISGGLDEYSIHDLIHRGASIDGIGVGSHFATSHHAPDLDIVYKLVEYDGRPTSKTVGTKITYPGRKSLVRTMNGESAYEKDTVVRFPTEGDLLAPFAATEEIASIRRRFETNLQRLKSPVKRIVAPDEYPVEVLIEKVSR